MDIPNINDLLMPNIPTMVTQLCATAILFFLMYKLAWKPVKKIMDTRSEQEQSKLDHAEAMAKENDQLNEAAKKHVSEAHHMAYKIIEETKADSEAIKEEIVAEGKKEAQELIDKANYTIEQEREAMIENIHDEIIDVAMAATEKLILSKMDEKADKESIDHFIREVSDAKI
ncbi:MAG: F0F1 ATP synthase subunit B [Erysipelotrichaceae bacterium]|nr:F0F1 ATP synthase subunit B [Erysipelotrichaceae bacterium]